MYDSLGRKINYMRVSITDRCNLRCKYCMPEEGRPSHNNMLSYDEILQLCKIAAKQGICKIKVTGGEPLLRKGCIDFLRKLKSIAGIEHVSLTTNGILLEPYINDMPDIGLNISLDSLNAETYTKITQRDYLSAVKRSLYKAVAAGLRVRINCVPLAGLNDKEVTSFASLAESMPVDVRFIELMPSNAGIDFKGIASTEILKSLLKTYPDLTADTEQRGSGPARYFRSNKLLGSIGIIGSYFCQNCNRIRLTSDGFLKLCLFSDKGLDLRAMLRNGAEESEIKTAFALAVQQKPERNIDTEIKNMSQIGG